MIPAKRFTRVRDGLFSEEQCTCAPLEFAHHLAEVRTDFALDSDMAEHDARQAGILTRRRENQDASLQLPQLDVSYAFRASKRLAHDLPQRVPRSILRGIREVALHLDATTLQAEVADSALVIAAALLDHRDRLTHFALRLVVAQQDDRVGQVAGVDWRFHLAADDPVVGADQDA